MESVLFRILSLLSGEGFADSNDDLQLALGYSVHFNSIFIYPSILFLLSSSGSWGCGGYLSCVRAGGRVQPGRVASLSQG